MPPNGAERLSHCVRDPRVPLGQLRSREATRGPLWRFSGAVQAGAGGEELEPAAADAAFTGAAVGIGDGAGHLNGGAVVQQGQGAEVRDRQGVDVQGSVLSVAWSCNSGRQLCQVALVPVAQRLNAETRELASGHVPLGLVMWDGKRRA